jgi:myosin-15
LLDRGGKENTQGWTLVLQEDLDRYELMGYDYVLDLVSEMEIAPAFPHGRAYFLVSYDRSQVNKQKRHHDGSPHNAESERILVLVGPLPEMLRRTTPLVAEHSRYECLGSFHHSN